jgi:hypothetical protein
MMATFAILLMQNKVHAADQPSSAWIAECERRNILFGCPCDCDVPVNSIGEYMMCDKTTSTFTSNQCTADKYVKDKCVPKESTDKFSVFPNYGKGILIINTDGSVNLGGTIRNIVYLLALILGAVAVGIVMLGMYKMASAGGDDTKIKEGSSAIWSALLGIIIIILGVVLGVTISYTVGFKDTTLPDITDDCKTDPANEQGLRCLFDPAVKCLD